MRIAIVNDMAIARESLRRVILSVPGHEIAWMARDGYEAVHKAGADLPDLILMDLMMPKMDGVGATREIMARFPCPILVVTATVNTNAPKVFEAMGHGALDAVTVPMMGDGAEAQRSRYVLLRKISMLEKLKGTRLSGPKPPGKGNYRPVPLVLIGSSTGGPRALARIISDMPANLKAAIIIVQHVDERFSAGLANWLNSQTSLQVQLAPQGGMPRARTVYVAGTNDHLILSPDRTFSYTALEDQNPFRPSVDIFFKSAAENWKLRDRQQEKGIAALLTGMGKDGAQGLAALRKAGWHTIAQDESTSVVFGMPKAAIEIGAATKILPVTEIGPVIVSMLNEVNGKR